MTLDVAAQLLAGVLVLLQAAVADPALPQPVRDQVQGLTQQAITESTRAIGAAGQGGTPSCAITSDKYNYRLGEIIFLSWESKNAASLAFMLGDKEEALTASDIDVSIRGVWRARAESAGYPFVTMRVTDADGRSASCSAMVEVR